MDRVNSPVRRPNHLRVLIIGAVVGFAIGAFLGVYGGLEPSSRVVQGEYSTSTAVGYLGILGAIVVGLLAAAVSIVIETVSERRHR